MTVTFCLIVPYIIHIQVHQVSQEHCENASLTGIEPPDFESECEVVMTIQTSPTTYNDQTSYDSAHFEEVAMYQEFDENGSELIYTDGSDPLVIDEKQQEEECDISDKQVDMNNQDDVMDVTPSLCFSRRSN